MKTLRITALLLLCLCFAVSRTQDPMYWAGLVRDAYVFGKDNGILPPNAPGALLNFLKDMKQTIFAGAGKEIPSDERLQLEVERLFDPLAGTSTYDMILHVDSLLNIADSKGWRFNASSADILSQRIQDLKNFEGQSVCAIGDYNTGKTFVFNLVEQIHLPSGFGNVTSGFSFLWSRKNPNVLLIDTFGQKRTVSSSDGREFVSLEDRIATDAFAMQVLLRQCDVIFYVTGPLRTPEIETIDNLFQTQRLYGKSKLESFYVVHNFAHMGHIEHVQRHIEDDIEKAFGATKLVGGAGCPLWRSHDRQMIHVVLGAANSPAGNAFNPCSVSVLQNKIKAAIAGNTEQRFLPRLTSTTRELLGEFFWLPGFNTDYVPFVVAPYQIVIGKDGATRIEFFDNVKRTEHMEVLKKINSAASSAGDGRAASASSSGWLDSLVNLFSHRAAAPKTEAVAAGAPATEIQSFSPFEVVFDRKQTSLRLTNPNVTLKYLPFYGDKSAIYWTPKHELYIRREGNEFEWSLVLDISGVVRQDLQVFCPMEYGEEAVTRVMVVGIRRPPDYLFSLRKKSPFTRQYGSFSVEITLPDEITPCTNLLRDGMLIQDGVLSLTQRRAGGKRTSIYKERFLDAKAEPMFIKKAPVPPSPLPDHDREL